jgi:hypothetical protein
MRTSTITDIKDKTATKIESFTPSIWTVLGCGVAGVLVGISIGWYLAGGVKIEEHYFQARNAAANVTKVEEVFNTTDEETA